MRFTVAWSEVVTQNTVLRIAILSMSVSLIGLLVALTKIATREPLVIERACFSSVAAIGSAERSESEVLSFLREAIASRFDSDAVPQDGFISMDERQFREQEQRGFREKEIKQRVLVNRIDTIKGGPGKDALPEFTAEFTVDADRILTIGTVRSALPFPLRVTISSVTRSRGNPYGLRLIQVKSQEQSNAK